MSRESQKLTAGTDLEFISELTDDFQTILPEAVRETLNLEPLDTLRFTIYPTGKVVLSRAQDSSDDDPAVGHFLAFLDTDIARHPERTRPIDPAYPERLRKLLGKVSINLGEKLPSDDPSEDGLG